MADSSLIERRAEAERQSRQALARAAMLEALAACIVERGYVATTVTDIVRVARVSKTTFYAQFADKEAVLLSLHAQLTEQLQAMITRADAAAREQGLGWRDRLEYSLRTYLQALLAGDHLTRCMLIEAPAVSERARLARRTVIDRYVDLLYQLVAQVNADEGRHSSPSRALLVGAVGGVHELILQALETDDADLGVLVRQTSELLGLLYESSDPRS